MDFFYNYSLQSLNSFNIEAYAANYIRFNRLKDIENFCVTVDVNKIFFHILGGGSNTLFVGDFSGYLLHIQLPGIEILQETASQVLVKAAAGVSWHQLVLFCVKNGYGGIENLSLIPGTVGGAVFQNIGAYGVEIKDVINSVEAVELSTGKKRIFSQLECLFGYRTTVFKTKLSNQYLIVSIVLVLHKKAKFNIEYGEIQVMLATMGVKQLSFKAVSDAVVAIRQRKLPNPTILGNAGSFFQNPLISVEQYQLLKIQYPDLVAFPTDNKEFIKISAAWLIEAVGFKGIRKGDVGVYGLHALILVHYGGAHGKAILDLAEQIKEKVVNRFAITLLPEVNIVRKINI